MALLSSKFHGAMFEALTTWMSFRYYCFYMLHTLYVVHLNVVCVLQFSCLLQTDTSLAIEAKVMQRWEFDSIAQAASSISSWFLGTLSEQLLLKEYLDSAIGTLLPSWFLWWLHTSDDCKELFLKPFFHYLHFFFSYFFWDLAYLILNHQSWC